MSYNKSIDSSAINTDLTSVANAIRTKTGSSNQLAFPSGFISEINNIPTGSANCELLKANMVLSNSGSTYTGDSNVPLNRAAVNTDLYLFNPKSGDYTAFTCQYTYFSTISKNSNIAYSVGTRPNTRSVKFTFESSVGDTSITPTVTVAGVTLNTTITGDLYVIHMGDLVP